MSLSAYKISSYFTIISFLTSANAQKCDNSSRITGLRFESSSRQVDLDAKGIPELYVEEDQVLRIFGANLAPNNMITFTPLNGSRGDKCDQPIRREFTLMKTESNFNPFSAKVKVNIPHQKTDDDIYFICLKQDKGHHYIHQGNDYWLAIETEQDSVPLWGCILIIIACLCSAFLMSGLNLGLMSLDTTELKIISNIGGVKEKKYAAKILPVRKHGNYMLCSVVLGNTLANSIFTIFFERLTTGMIAVIASTLLITLLGEIVPQAVCSRYNLIIGAKTIVVTKVVMTITFPISYPMAKLLNLLLGDDMGTIYNRERLKELINMTPTRSLGKDEINIISGVLELHKKTVADVMTRIEDVYMLDYEAKLDFELVTDIMKSGYSRIPVYHESRNNIVNVLYIKDLAFIDPDDNTPLKTVCQFYQNPVTFVPEDLNLVDMFNIFKQGNQGHMAIVQKPIIQNDISTYEITGLITLEDVIEELIQSEIMDETDVYTDNRTKRRRLSHRRQYFSVSAEKRDFGKTRISPPLLNAAFYFLRNRVDRFSDTEISETVLWRLLKQNIYFHIKKNKNWKTDSSCVIYERGVVSDFFALILEGRAEVMIGRENLVFEAGPFMYFGIKALSYEALSDHRSNVGSFVADYTVKAMTEVVYLKIKSALYLSARKAHVISKSSENIQESVNR